MKNEISEFFRSEGIAYNVFSHCGVTTLAELSAMSDEDLLKIRQMGKIRVSRLREYFDTPAVKPWRGPKWEYMVASNSMSDLNNHGETGWELICIDRGIYIFKRHKI